jgi:hypothetical protein
MAFRSYVALRKTHLDDLLATTGNDLIADGLEYGGVILGIGLFVVDPTFTVAGIISAFGLPAASRTYKAWKARRLSPRLRAAETALIDAISGLRW